MAWELKRLYTNDKPKRKQGEDAAEASPPDEDEPDPLDEDALGELATILPTFAELLRRRLPMGNRWCLVDDGVPGEPMADDVSRPEHWKMRVQVEATAEWKRIREMNCNPTRASIRPHLLRRCKENDVFTKGGINPSDGYLRTHVLSARHWNPPT